MTGARMSRRSLLTVLGLGGAEALLAACSSRSAAVVTKTSSTTVVGSGSGASSGSAVPSAPAVTSASASATVGSSAPAASSSSGVASSSAVSSTPSSKTAVASSTAPTGAPVHARLYQSDGRTYGVGMPIIVYLSSKITNAKAFAAATKVTVNGAAATGAWFFQKSAVRAGFPMEAHYRLQNYWPAHSTVNLDLPIQGLSAGTGLVFNDSLTLKMNIGASNITTVDGATERLTLTTDGAAKFNFPVSLGKASTPTFTGTKVVMERDKVERMVGTTPGDQYDLQVPWSVRLTNSGEFIHSASWNGGNIGQRSTSNGCTNLNVNDAEQYYNFAKIGDVAVYVNTGGSVMPVWDGYGDWNLPWAQWSAGGAVSTS